jgi:hypothetical protein
MRMVSYVEASLGAPFHGDSQQALGLRFLVGSFQF